LTSNYSVDGVLLVYSVANRCSFEHLKNWVCDVSNFIDIDTLEWALIGNKCDFIGEVEKNYVEAYREQLDAKLSCTVSAKTGENVLQAFNDLVRTIHENRTCVKLTQPA